MRLTIEHDGGQVNFNTTEHADKLVDGFVDVFGKEALDLCKELKKLFDYSEDLIEEALEEKKNDENNL